MYSNATRRNRNVKSLCATVRVGDRPRRAGVFVETRRADMSFPRGSCLALVMTGLVAFGVRADDEVYGPPDPLQGMVDELGARQGSGGDDSGQPAVGERDSGPGGLGTVYGPPDPEVYGPPAPSDSALDAPPGSPDSMDEMRYPRRLAPEENGTSGGYSPESFDEIRRGRQDGTANDYGQVPQDDQDGAAGRPNMYGPGPDMIGRPGPAVP
jgi:hypothetical protein